MRKPWLPLTLLLVAGATLGCNTELDTEELQFTCNTSEDCLPGYVCAFESLTVQDQVCVPEDALPDMTIADGGTDAVDMSDMSDACEGACRPGEACVDGICTCGTESAAEAGAAVCASGEACCAGRCGDPTSAVCNCGGDGIRCGSGEDCCGEACVSVIDDPDQCGACENVCGDGAQACLTTECGQAEGLVAGTSHTCARYADGRVMCWGNGADGRLGIDVSGALQPDTFVDTELRFDTLAAGAAFTCGLADDASAHCWGQVSDALGLASSGAAPAAVDLDVGATGVWAGFETACVATADDLRCAGADALAAGHGDGGFAAVHALGGVGAVALGASHTCAVGTRNGTEAVWCWGTATAGRLGPDAPPSAGEPVMVDLGSIPTALAAGQGHTCAIVGNGVSCWGADADGQLGGTTPTSEGEPVAVDLPAGCAPVQIASGALHTCVRCDDARVACWGRSTEGQLGVQGADGSPAAVPDLSVASIATGQQHTCALRTDGVAVCWGANGSGRLGIGVDNVPSVSTPTVVVGPSTR